MELPAIKVMREDLAEDLEFLRRFKREARALAALSHDNIVRFYSFEREGRLAFIQRMHEQVMQKIGGKAQ